MSPSCNLLPLGSGLELSGETLRARFVSAHGLPDAGVTALHCILDDGSPWVGYSLCELTLTTIVDMLNNSQVPPTPWVTLHLLLPELHIVGRMDID